ncbi:hypothetical protein [Streptomyces sp. YIM S03343]
MTVSHHDLAAVGSALGDAVLSRLLPLRQFPECEQLTAHHHQIAPRRRAQPHPPTPGAASGSIVSPICPAVEDPIKRLD